MDHRSNCQRKSNCSALPNWYRLPSGEVSQGAELATASLEAADGSLLQVLATWRLAFNLFKFRKFFTFLSFLSYSQPFPNVDGLVLVAQPLLSLLLALANHIPLPVLVVLSTLAHAFALPFHSQKKKPRARTAATTVWGFELGLLGLLRKKRKSLHVPDDFRKREPSSHYCCNQNHSQLPT